MAHDVQQSTVQHGHYAIHESRLPSLSYRFDILLHLTVSCSNIQYCYQAVTAMDALFLPFGVRYTDSPTLLSRNGRSGENEVTRREDGTE